MPSVAVILDTTPEYFRLWLKDATYPYTEPFSDDCMMSQNPTVGGFYDRDLCWEVLALYFNELPDDFLEDTLITFEVIPIAPTRIKVRAYSDELGRLALDALIVKMQEELSGTQLATITSTKEAKEVALDEPNVPKRGGASRLEERELTDQMKGNAIRYLHRVWSRKSNSPSRQKIASVLGVGDYRTIEGWIKTWPEIEEQARREYEQGQKRK